MRERERDEVEKSCYFIYKGKDENGAALDTGDKIDAFIDRLQPLPLNHDKNYPAGDFRSAECIELLKQSDIVITNPPFSLFREYVAQLVKYDKKFLILGNMNAISYKEIFKLIKDNQIWTGFKPFGGGMDMIQSKANFDENKTKSFKIDPNGNIIKNIMGVIWFTNLEHKKRHEFLETIWEYAKNPEKYPKYDNYDAINVNKTAEIPLDYDGVMGVPITFLDKYNPEQFEILGATESEGKGASNGLWYPESKVAQPLVDKKRIYKRLFIKNKNPQKA